MNTNSGSNGSSSSKRKKRKPGKRRLSAAEKRARRERRRKYMTIFINGKQKRVPRPTLIEGLTVDEFLARNADPMWLHQNEMWELIPCDDVESWPDSGEERPGDCGR
ncbi:MAG TPA: hypothetical protein VG125_03580 [Pirellulales bacterium]|nr:hypothetical protein [Pirellulales bacterium]